MFFLYNVLDPTKQSINVEKSKWHKGFVQEVKRLQQKFWSLSAILLFLWQIKSSLSNASILETRNTNKNTSAPTDLSSFVNPNKQNLCQDDEKSQEANHKENRRKCSRKKKRKYWRTHLNEYACVNWVGRTAKISRRPLQTAKINR